MKNNRSRVAFVVRSRREKRPQLPLSLDADILLQSGSTFGKPACPGRKRQLRGRTTKNPRAACFDAVAEQERPRLPILLAAELVLHAVWLPACQGDYSRASLSEILESRNAVSRRPLNARDWSRGIIRYVGVLDRIDSLLFAAPGVFSSDRIVFSTDMIAVYKEPMWFDYILRGGFLNF